MDLLLWVLEFWMWGVFHQVLSRNQIAVRWFSAGLLGDAEVQTDVVVDVYGLRGVRIALRHMREVGFVPEALALRSPVYHRLGRLVHARMLPLTFLIVILDLIDNV